jgi:hypothetical protein
MTSIELENLVQIGRLKRVPPEADVIESLIRSGGARLADSGSPGLSNEGRFDLAYNAVYTLALAALRRLGFQSDRSLLVFQVLPYTLGLPPSTIQVLANCHNVWLLAEHKGLIDVDERILTDLIGAANAVWSALTDKDQSSAT